ncbi:hypothetical protein AHAS_Ahas07G0156100 [Arachis hypogaea]
MNDINICSGSSNSAIETECTTEIVIIHPSISDEEIPKVGMLFGTLEEACQFCYNYANKVEFEPHIRNTNFVKNERTPINQSIQCNRDGYRTKKNPETQRKFSMHVKDVIERNDQVGIRPSKTFQVVADEAGGRSNLEFEEKDADARSRAAYEYFSEVVSFDTTYKLNKFEMPVAAFVGVNHHGRSCLFGCALLGNEETESFEWLMQTFVKCMGKAPDGILTNQCGAIEITIQNVMPNTRHKLCIWYIIKKIPHKLGRLSRYKEIIEWEYDAADNKGLIPCVSNSPIEKQFQYEYTNYYFTMFKPNLSKSATTTCLQGLGATASGLSHMVSSVTTPYRFYLIDFVHDKEEADILHSAFASAKVALSEHRPKHSESIHTSECLDRLNALRSPPQVDARRIAAV